MNNHTRPALRRGLFVAAIALLSLTGRSATTFTWNVPSPGGANNWNVNANWLPATGNPGSADAAVFGSTGTNTSSTSVNNVVSVNTTITSLTYNHFTNGTWHVTQIPDAVTLTVSGNVTNGGGGGDGLVTQAAMTGGGTFQVNGNNLIIENMGAATLTGGTIMDLSGLTNFIYNASSGVIGVGVSNRSVGNLSLANGSNYITAGTINLNTGSSSSSGQGGNIKFGAGTNVVNVNNINIGANRTSGTMNFVTTTGGLRMRGVAGGDADRVGAVTLGNRNTGSSTGGTTTGTWGFNGHPVDVKITTLTMGQETSAANAGLIGVGNVQFDQGVMDVTTINMAIVTGSHSNNAANGTMTVGANGTLLVNNVSLANTALTTNGISATGTLLVDGGTAICTNNIIKTGTLSVNTGVVAVANSGTLLILGKIGTPANPVDNLNVTNGNIKLRVDGSGSITTNIFATTVNPGGTTTFIIDQAIGVTGPTTFPLVSYATLNGTVAGNFAVTPPPGYIASLVDNSAQKRIDLSISPSVIIVPKIWAALTNSDWDLTTSNWLSSGAVATYTDFDATVFDDSASSSAVNLTGTFTPASMTMSNSTLTYTFSGSGSISGTNSLTQKGTQTTILDNSGSNSYTGGTLIGFGTLQVGNNDANGNLPAGTAVIDNSVLNYKRSDNVTNDNAISGTGTLTQSGSGTLTLIGGNSYVATTISAGTLQVGAGGTSGTLGSGAVADSAGLVFNRSDNITVGNAISGGGSVTKINNNVLTLNGNSGFGGGLNANAGTVRLASTNAAGAAGNNINIPAGGTVVLVTTNTTVARNIILSGGTLGGQFGAGASIPDTVTATASTTSTIVMGDPANLSPSQNDGTEMNFVNTLNGGGDLFLMTVNNDALGADSGSGLRFRGTAGSGYSGTITVSNNVKAELQTTVGGPFSPIGIGKIKMVCGAIFGTNVTTGPTIGGYSELNLRDNFTGDTIFTNDIELVGSGITLLNPLGTAALGSTIVMGQLKIGGGQELGLYLASGSSYHVLYFPRVSLTGGTATFSPKTPGFGAVASAGSLLSLGNITQSSPSGFVMNGLTNLYLVGTNSYTGATTVSNGFLFVNGSNGPSAITVYGGVLGGTGVISGPVEIAAGGTLGPGNSIGTLSVSNSLMLDANSTNTMEINASSVTSDQVVGLTSVTYAGTLNVVNLGGTLAANQTYKLFDAASYAGTFSATNLPALGTGLAWDVRGLNSNGTIKLIATVNLNPTNITVAVNGNQLTLSWPTDHLGWTLQTNISSVLDTNWFAVPGSESSTQAVITISPAVPNVFYRLVHVLP